MPATPTTEQLEQSLSVISKVDRPDTRFSPLREVCLTPIRER